MGNGWLPKPQTHILSSEPADQNKELQKIFKEASNPKEKPNLGEKPTKNERKKLEEYKKKLHLINYPELVEIIIGCMLGDASMQKQNGYQNWRLKFSQSTRLHLTYVEHLHEVFKDWVLCQPYTDGGVTSDGRKRTSSATSFTTISHPDFKSIADLFSLETGKKSIPVNLIKNYLTPRGLAYWFMDDGGKGDYSKNKDGSIDGKGKAITLNTQGFSAPEVEQLAYELQEKFGLLSSVKLDVKANKTYYYIQISGKSYDTFIDLVNPYMHESMRYKLPSARKIKIKSPNI